MFFNVANARLNVLKRKHLSVKLTTTYLQILSLAQEIKGNTGKAPKREEHLSSK